MLEKKDFVAGADVTPGRKRSIVIKGGASYTYIVYTVPEGMKFTGSTNATSVAIYVNSIGAISISPAIQLNLMAGDTVSFSAVQGVLFGIEEPA